MRLLPTPPFWEEWAQKLKQQAEEKQQREAERLRKDAIHIDRKGSFADDLDKTRELEATREKEEARIEEIYGQQEKNIEEGRRFGRVPLDDYDPPAPEVENPEPEPEPQYDNASEMLNQYEQAATPSNDNASTPEPQPQQTQEQGRDHGGYER